MVDPQTVQVHKLSEYDWRLDHFGFLDYNPTVYTLIASLFAVSLWLVVDLTAQVYITFKSYGGLYYYSILITTWGVAINTTGLIIKMYVHNNMKVFMTAVTKLGWIMSATGFSLVLYSRLNLVVQNRAILQGVLIAIIIDAFLFHVPTCVFSFGYSTPNAPFWLPYKEVMERVQVIGFTIQDLVLSVIYAWTSARLLSDRYSGSRRNLFFALLFAGIFGFVTDLVLVVLMYMDIFTLKVALYPFIQAVKLKVEFVVLNQLTNLVQPLGNEIGTWGESADSMQSTTPDIIETCSCERCQTFDEARRKSSGTTVVNDWLLVPADVNYQAPLNLRKQSFTPLSDLGKLAPVNGDNNEIDLEDTGIDALERQYLGRFG